MGQVCCLQVAATSSHLPGQPGRIENPKNPDPEKETHDLRAFLGEGFLKRFLGKWSALRCRFVYLRVSGSPDYDAHAVKF